MRDRARVEALCLGAVIAYNLGALWFLLHLRIGMALVCGLAALAAQLMATALEEGR